uniref:Vitelline membrane outer layer 1 homolog n=1 Tax=Podarcis muralis TaxID=64176 RepID=A0A670IWA2_PODMU
MACKNSFIAVSFSHLHQTEGKRGITGDDTSLNGIRLHCSSGGVRTTLLTFVVESKSFQFGWGEWTEVKKCPKGYLVAFTLKVEAPQWLGDNTAANNIQFKCGDGTVLEGESTDFGTYGDWSKHCTAGAICGIQTKVKDVARGDNTALNDVKFFCCD